MLDSLRTALADGLVIPYLGPGMMALAETDSPLPSTSGELAARLTAASAVPHKIRTNVTAAAQYIENFKHRKTLSALMTRTFAPSAAPGSLHRRLADLPKLPLLVHAWYDDLPQRALAGRSDWGIVQGVSQSEHWGRWVRYFEAEGVELPAELKSWEGAEGPVPVETPAAVAHWATLLYQPLGSVAPARNYIISDSDFVEVLTEIDIQTPIPEPVQNLRTGRHFLFLGCRFAQQTERSFARQVMKRSSDRHWAILPDTPSRNEQRFLEEQGIERLDFPLSEAEGLIF